MNHESFFPNPSIIRSSPTQASYVSSPSSSWSFSVEEGHPAVDLAGAVAELGRIIIENLKLQSLKKASFLSSPHSLSFPQ